MAATVYSSVEPSGAAFATSRVPTSVPAPGLLSTITGTPSASANATAMRRACRSVPPPGVNGTTMRMGLLGFHWALADALHARARASAVNRLFNDEGMGGSLVGITRPTGRGRSSQCTVSELIVIDHVCQ